MDAPAQCVSYRGDVVDPLPAEAFEPVPGAIHGEDRPRRRLQVALTLTVVAALVLATIGGTGLIRMFAPSEGNDVFEEAPATEPRLVAVDGAGGLTTMDQLGGSVVAYPVPGVAFEFPAWAPDGTSFAAIGRSAQSAGLYVFEARTQGQLPRDPVIVYDSVEQPPFYLYWAPGSQQVSFLTSEAQELALRIAPADGRAAAVTIREGAPIYWDFIDAGRLLVHEGAAGPGGFLGEVAVDGSVTGTLGGPPGVYRAPASSLAGVRAFVEIGDGQDGDGPTSDLVVEPLGGGGASRVQIFGPAALTFSAHGDQLAFIAADRPGLDDFPLPVGPLRVLDVASGQVRTLVDGRVVAFFWSSNGKAIAALGVDGTNDGVTEARYDPLGPGGAVTLAHAGESAGDSVEAAAGVRLRLTFVNAVTGSIVSQRLVRMSELFVNQVLPFFDQYALSHRVWSPDLSAVVLPIVSEDDVTELVAIPADGSEPRAVGTAEMGFWSH